MWNMIPLNENEIPPKARDKFKKWKDQTDLNRNSAKLESLMRHMRMNFIYFEEKTDVYKPIDVTFREGGDCDDIALATAVEALGWLGVTSSQVFVCAGWVQFQNERRNVEHMVTLITNYGSKSWIIDCTKIVSTKVIDFDNLEQEALRKFIPLWAVSLAGYWVRFIPKKGEN